MVIEANHKYVIPEFLFLLLTSTEVTEYFKVIAETRSGTFPQITFDSVSDYEVNLPSKEEQKDIVNRHLSKPRFCRKPMPMLESEKAPLPVGEGLG